MSESSATVRLACSHENLSIAVLMACHNRQVHTLESLQGILRQQNCRAKIQVFLFDDGSIDGTAEAVALQFPEVQLIFGDGNAYWARGMSIAEAAALDHRLSLTHVLWLNDDVRLMSTALCAGVNLLESCDVAVGFTVDELTKKRTYGAYRKSGKRLLAATLNPIGDECYTFCGNFVLFKIDSYRELGGIDPVYAHACADIDLGIRAFRAGSKIREISSPIGTCSANVQPCLTWLENVQAQIARKGMPLKDRWYMYRKFCGGTAVWEFLLSLVGILVRATRETSSRARRGTRTQRS